MKRKICWLAGLIFLGLLRPGLAAAQSDDAAWSATASYEFGQTMRFQLTAESDEPIERATLFIRAPEFANAFSTTQKVAPSRRVSVNYNLDLSQVQLAPFTTLTYWWLLETAVSEIALPEQTIAYDDDQFEWRQLERNGIAVHWTGDDPGLGQLGMDIVVESLSDLTSLIPTEDGLPLAVYMYPSSADLRAALRLAGQDWVGAHTRPELGVILVTAVNARTAAADLRQSIPHEMVHFLLYQAVGSNYDRLPVWFNEGLATFVEAAPNPSYETLLATAVVDQTTIPFADLCADFPQVEDRALLAYAQSASIIRYIQSRFGDRALGDLIAAYADGADCHSGASRVLGQTLDNLNRDWLRRQQPRSPFAQFWLDNGLWLLLVAGGFGITSLLAIIPSKKADG
ncbi:MAG: hypothetical protein GY803_14370 [Chloroflexi bacterium]|nr:hypothetical protein [Chloroflexota bacterium]